MVDAAWPYLRDGGRGAQRSERAGGGGEGGQESQFAHLPVLFWNTLQDLGPELREAVQERRVILTLNSVVETALRSHAFSARSHMLSAAPKPCQQIGRVYTRIVCVHSRQYIWQVQELLRSIVSSFSARLVSARCRLDAALIGVYV